MVAILVALRFVITNSVAEVSAAMRADPSSDFAEDEFSETSFSTAARLCSGARWAYRIVIWIVLCPINSATVRRSTPAITSRLAKV